MAEATGVKPHSIDGRHSTAVVQNGGKCAEMRARQTLVPPYSICYMLLGRLRRPALWPAP
jgi:hypothetical protein